MSRPDVARALAYPFAPPPRAFVLEVGAERAFDPAADARLIDGRRPILAVGSNAAPRRLREKFGDRATLAVTEAFALDAVVAHSAKITAYGSIPATLHAWPGATARIHVTWLDDAMLALMDRTEALGVAYDRVPVLARLECSPDVRPIETYRSRAGAFGLAGRPAASAAARLEGADGLQRFDQRAIQALAMALLGVEGEVEAFVAENLADPALRRSRSSRLTRLVGLASTD